VLRKRILLVSQWIQTPQKAVYCTVSARPRHIGDSQIRYVPFCHRHWARRRAFSVTRKVWRSYKSG